MTGPFWNFCLDGNKMGHLLCFMSYGMLNFFWKIFGNQIKITKSQLLTCLLVDFLWRHNIGVYICG